MGIDFFAIAYELKNKNNISWNEEELSELGYDIYDLLYKFLTDTLTRKAEADYLENLDTYLTCGCVYDFYIEKDELDFCIKDYVWNYSRVGIHWFGLASIIYCSEIDKVLNKYNWQIQKQKLPSSLEKFQKYYGLYPTFLTRVKDELYLIDEDEKTVSPDEEQTMPILSKEEKETILKIIETKECQCQLCQKIRAGNLLGYRLRLNLLICNDFESDRV